MYSTNCGDSAAARSSARVAGGLRALRGRGRVVMTSDQRVTAENHGRYVYPDVSVVGGKLELEPNEVLVNPALIVEVLSASTEQHDRGLRWDGYQGIASLQDYVLVAQTEPRIEHYQRAADGSWTYRAARAGQRVTLSIGAVLILDELYAGVLDVPGDEAG